MQQLENFINGKLVPTSTPEVTELVNPTTGKVFATAPVSGQAEVDAAYAAAQAGFAEWKDEYCISSV